MCNSKWKFRYAYSVLSKLFERSTSTDLEGGFVGEKDDGEKRFWSIELTRARNNPDDDDKDFEIPEN